MPMSDISHDCSVINFEEKRREFIIRELIKKQSAEPEQIVQILGLHEFLLYIENIKKCEEEIDQEVLEKLKSDIQLVKEKFDELFEIIK